MPLSRQAAVVEAFLARGGTLQSRLRECSTGDVHDMPAGFLPLPDVPLPSVVTALEELETYGVVAYSLIVHPFDSAEYRVSWHLTGKRGAEGR